MDSVIHILNSNGKVTENHRSICTGVMTNKGTQTDRKEARRVLYIKRGLINQDDSIIGKYPSLSI